MGTLWGWLSFLLLDRWLGDVGWGVAIVAALAGAACGPARVTARHLGIADPGAIVWDEVVAFWIVLWLLTPASAWDQLLAFALFRYFDAAKPGPVGWADRLCKLHPGQAIGWRQGWGILFDDLVAAGVHAAGHRAGDGAAAAAGPGVSAGTTTWTCRNCDPRCRRWPRRCAAAAGASPRPRAAPAA